MARVVSSSVAAGGTLNQDVLTGGAEYLSLTGIVGTVANAAGAAGDVSVSVLAYMDDAPSGGTVLLGTLAPTTLALPVLDSAAAVLAASRAWIFNRIRVAGIRAVQIQVKNNNIAAKPAEVNYDLG